MSIFCLSRYGGERHQHSFPTRRSSDLDEERAHLPAFRPGLGRHGVLLRQPGGAGRQGDRLPERRFRWPRSEEHTSELQSRVDLVCRLLLEKINAPARAAVFFWFITFYA